MRSRIQKTYLRLSLLTASIALLSAFVLVVGLNWYTARMDLQEDLTMQARVIGANSTAALAFDNAQDAEETLAALTHAPVVVAATLYRNNGKVMASFHRDGTWGPRASTIDAAHASQQGLIRIETPITLENRPLGTLILWGTLAPLYVHQLRFLAGFTVIAALAGAIAYLAGHGIRHRLAENQVELEQSRTLLRQLTAYRDKVVEEEHKRIAREIHDELGQVLTTALLHLKRLDRVAAGGGFIPSEQIKEIGGLVEDGIRGVKGIAAQLRPAVLNIGLPSAMEWLVERADLANNGIECDIDIPDALAYLDDPYATALFRIVQESLTNVVRHAKATAVKISLRQESHWLQLEVADNGIGLRPANDGGQHFGLIGIQERAAALGGRADISGKPGQGTRVRVSLPYSSAS